jgi:outer membrane receptor protein involved in Fe transport
MVMNLRTATLFAACVAAAALACPAHAQTDTAHAATAATPAPPAATAPAARPHHNRNEITRADMVEKGARNVYDGIRMLHAAWLRPSRALSSSTQQNPVVAVYRDGSLVGGTGTLRDMSVDSVARVEYVDPSDAVQRYGTDAAGGAIVVYTGA